MSDRPGYDEAVEAAMREVGAFQTTRAAVEAAYPIIEEEVRADERRRIEEALRSHPVYGRYEEILRFIASHKVLDWNEMQAAVRADERRRIEQALRDAGWGDSEYLNDAADFVKELGDE